MQFVDVAAGDDEEVGAVARLGERRHHPAGGLQHSEIAILGVAQRMVDDAAALFREGDDRADAFDVGCEAAEDRQAAFTDETGRGSYGFVQRHIFAVDLRSGFRERPFEAGNRFHAAVL